MRLLHCRVQNVRLHADLPLRFDPGLTLIGGVNESGKSTLVEALHRTLFLKASAAGAPVEALRSRLHPGHPTVELGFEAGGDRWTLAKRFSGSSGTVALRSEGGERFSGPAAEDRLAALLGVGETLGAKQVARLPLRWAHLWVQQGTSGDNFLQREAGSYDLDTLIERLEARGGAALQSAHDQWVAGQIETLLADTYTQRKGDVRRQSPLGLAQQELSRAEAALAEAEARLAALEAAAAELAELEEGLEQLQSITLPDREQRRLGLLQAGEQAQALRHQLALQARELEPMRLRQQALQESCARLGEVEGARLQAERQLQEVRARVAAAQHELEELAARRHQAQTVREDLAAQRQAIEQRGQLVARRLQAARLRRERGQLEAALAEGRRQRERRTALQGQLAALPPLEEAQLRQLRSQERTAAEARVRLEALAAGVELLQGDQEVRLAGQLLTPGREVRLTTPAELSVGEGVRLRLSPGGGRALAEGQATLRRAEQALTAGLAALALSDLEAAEALLRQRQELTQQLAALQAASADTTAGREDDPALEDRLAALATEEEGLERELEALAELRHQELRHQEEQQEPLPTDLPELELLHRQLQQTYQRTGAPFRQADSDLAALAQRQEALRTSLEQARLREGPLVTEREFLTQRRAELLAAYAGAEPLAAEAGLEPLRQAVAHGAAALAAAEAELERRRRELAALEAAAAPGTLAELEAEIGRLQQQRLQLTARRGAVRERCEAIASGDPYAAIEQAQAWLETAQADHQALRRQGEALLLLRQLFSEAQADLSSRYSEPLARAVEAYLGPLLGEEGGCRLRCDPGTGLSGLQLRRGGEYYDFATLSGGMREQLAAALRLAMADVLKEAHGGCLPLVFDDAFTFSDPQRVAVVRSMLATAVERGLQVILLTCSPHDYASLQGSVVELPSPVA